MPQLIQYGNEQIRINQAKNHIEVSTTRGASWYTRYSGSGCGEFRDLIVYGTELIALTSKGIYVSTSKGASWYCRCSSSTCHTFTALLDSGRELLANTSDGHLYVSTSKGASWFRRK